MTGPNVQARYWCFQHFDLETFVVPDEHNTFRYCVYQTEACPKTGSWHNQGYVEFTRTIRRKKVQELFGGELMNCKPKYENSTRTQARAYCMKEDTRVAEPVEHGVWVPDNPNGTRTDLVKAVEIIRTKRKLADCYDDPALYNVVAKYPKFVALQHAKNPVEHVIDIELYDWQAEVIGMLEQDVVHRRIIWIWSTASNTGKTTFKDYISLKMDVLPARGPLADILYAYDKNDVIWFDYTRAEKGYESYKSLEDLSNIGWKLSTKFHSLRKFVKAHIVVTSNHAPDETKLPDRFYVVNIDPPSLNNNNSNSSMTI